MKLDTRSEMALSLIVNMKMSPAESFTTLAYIVKGWGWDSRQSLPLAHELVNRLGLSHEEAAQIIRGETKQWDVHLAISNKVN